METPHLLKSLQIPQNNLLLAQSEEHILLKIDPDILHSRLMALKLLDLFPGIILDVDLSISGGDRKKDVVVVKKGKTRASQISGDVHKPIFLQVRQKHVANSVRKQERVAKQVALGTLHPISVGIESQNVQDPD